jgi:hypothetical protein
MEISGKNLKFKYLTEEETNQMNKKAMEGLKKEESLLSEIYDTKKSIRHLEIELDYEDSRKGNDYKYIKSLEAQIDEQYIKLDRLYEINKISES